MVGLAKLILTHWFMADYGTYRNQSTMTIRVLSSTGRPTAANTITMVMRPACGTPAAPMDAAVAVILKKTMVPF